MKSGSLRLIEEMVDGFRQVRPDAREALLSRITEAVGEEIATWLRPLLRDPPSPAQLEELKAALRVHAKSAEMLQAALEARDPYWKFVCEFRDSAAAGRRALAALAAWATGRPEPEEDDGDDD